MLDLSQINIWAVLLATAATMVLGFLWYSPLLFGNAWAKRLNVNMEDLSGGAATYVLTALTALGGAFILAWLVSLAGEPTIASGMTIGLLVGISISLKIGMNYLFEGRKLGLYLITVGYHLISYLIAGLIIGVM
ncbi:DUF1761 domain-containing protein [Paenibacillus profundus]|uniref:DUF1761 domain-containing protein n=1 Tax=Paenibacillus profundus TaxID=1173085 RepID=A0ABS8YBP5_9BACL|nr:DUF1761 domain-containing protein [Paenibacillus profundus]MCE5168387.1 DUF1761 domain-containing protein [Paenibacillus profundus]